VRILLIHNRYRIRAGEDTVFDRETELLRKYGHEIETWTLDNESIASRNPIVQFQLALNTIWSVSSYQQLQHKIQQFRPDIVHVHNILPLLSPAIYYACRDRGVPVVQTIHNYRLGCPAGTYFRAGQICELCQQRSLWQSIRFGCYRNARLQTAVVAGMLQVHRWLGTWHHVVTSYIAISPFLKGKLLALGIPAEKIFLKPNYVSANPINPVLTTNQLHTSEHQQFGSYYLFVGRLVEEKGIRTLLEGYQLSRSGFPLTIAGTGELENIVVEAVGQNPMIRYVGLQTRAQVLELMQGAIALIFPSIWYEGLPVSILEAYSCSLPAIGSNLGAMGHAILPELTGQLFAPADAADLARKITELEANPQKWLSLKQNLKQYVDPAYFADANYHQLMQIYQRTIQKFRNAL
jgi:glycosyltransferase involved in cell wall biosynthesis